MGLWAIGCILNIPYRRFIVDNKKKFLNGKPVDFLYHALGTALTTRVTLADQNKSFVSDISRKRGGHLV